jgi:hypothetical protein
VGQGGGRPLSRSSPANDKEDLLLVISVVTIGLSSALTTTRRIPGLLFGLTLSDPLTVVPAYSLLLRVAALAGYPSARPCRADGFNGCFAPRLIRHGQII